MKHFIYFKILIFLILLTHLNVVAQPKNEHLLQSEKEKILHWGLVVQSVADFQGERTQPGQNGFSIATVRLNARGVLGEKFGYFVQTDFTRSVPLLDAKIYLEWRPECRLDVGVFKAPFSKEYLTSVASIDFVNRSQIVSAFSLGRQIGFQMSGRTAGEVLSWQAGVFNGNGFGANANDDGRFLYAARVAIFPRIFSENNNKDQLEIGVNAATSRDSHVSIGGGLIPGYSGKRNLLGGDIRLMYGRLLVAGEYIQIKLEADTGDDHHPSGFYGTVGYTVSNSLQALIRWDRFDSENLLANGSKADLFILGLNLTPVSMVGVQLNYIIYGNDEDFKHHQFLMNTQVSL